jgi:hypothetical protein
MTLVMTYYCGYDVSFTQSIRRNSLAGSPDRSNCSPRDTWHRHFSTVRTCGQAAPTLVAPCHLAWPAASLPSVPNRNAGLSAPLRPARPTESSPGSEPWGSRRATNPLPFRSEPCKGGTSPLQPEGLAESSRGVEQGRRVGGRRPPRPPDKPSRSDFLSGAARTGPALSSLPRPAIHSLGGLPSLPLAITST